MKILTYEISCSVCACICMRLSDCQNKNYTNSVPCMGVKQKCDNNHCYLQLHMNLHCTFIHRPYSFEP